MSEKPSLTLTRRIKAPAEKVYKAWTVPSEISRWFGRAGTHCDEVKADVRVGGCYAILSHTADGGEHRVGGIYREIVENKKLVFTWAWRTTPERESLVTVLFESKGVETELTLIHENFFDADARERHRMGWSGSLDHLVAVLEHPQTFRRPIFVSQGMTSQHAK
jgi:uncharacterized protein YndB with AHSA1/START domain